MSNNLLELVNECITGDVIAKVADFLGESPTNTTSALSKAIPSLLAGIVNKGADAQGQGASNLLNLLSQGNHDGSILTNFLSHFSGGSEGTKALLSAGTSLLNSVFGNKTEGVANLVANASGISKVSSNSLLGLIMPLVFGALGKVVKSLGIVSPSGLMDLLETQKGFLKNFLPSGLSNILDTANFNTMLKTSSAASTTQIVDDSSPGGLAKLLPWLLLLALLGLGWGFWKYFSQNKDASVDTASISSTPETKVPEVVAPAIDKISDFFEKTLSSGFAIKAAKDGVESNLITFIEDANKPVDKETWFNMNGIEFDTGKATLRPESNVQITNIVEILKAYPSVKLKIGGYTDNTGNAKANVKLSGDRATSVKNAIISAGIDAGRLESEGYGSEHPVATNDTEEGRQRNRRIDVRVTAK